MRQMWLVGRKRLGGRFVVGAFTSVLCLCGFLTGLSAEASTANSDIGKQWAKVQDDATVAMDQNKYWIAEPELKRALELAENFGESDLRLAKTLGELGRYYTIRGRFAEAEPYLEREWYIKEKVLGTDKGQAIPATGSLIKFYLTYGTASKADPLAKDMLDFLEGKIDEQTGLPRGKVVYKKGQTVDAWAGTVAPTMRDPVIDWAITCDALGNLYRLRGDHEMAGRFYRNALDVKETVLGKVHLSLANSYDSLGMLALDRKDYADAETNFKEALELTEKTLGADTPDAYGRLDKLAKCLVKQGKFGEAESLYLRAQNFWKAEPSKNGDEARAMFALGCLYCDQKKFAQAAPVLQKALRMAEHFNGPDSAGLVPYLEKYAYVLYYLGRKGDQEYLKARASSISG